MDEQNGLKRLGRQKCAIIIFLITLLLVFVTGCDKYTKHKVLTFFFTGVPSLDNNESKASIDSIDSTDKTEVKKVQSKVRWSSTHGPYGAGECFQCHKIKAEKKEFMLGSFPNLQSLPRTLLMPKNEICIECHTTKSFNSAFTKNLWIHGPVSAGMCTACHHHHVSAFPYLILKETSRQLCAQCHIDGSITMIEEHMQNKECLACHNPHLGKNRFLLKKDFFEIY
jgi:predicted CXXCH cytochrome family protein